METPAELHVHVLIERPGEPVPWVRKDAPAATGLRREDDRPPLGRIAEAEHGKPFETPVKKDESTRGTLWLRGFRLSR
jgi:hypothetical protein